jgi:hypothetical protein
MLLLYHFRRESDAVPGRLNQWLVILIVRCILWTMLELCGINHGYMPIEVVGINMPAQPPQPMRMDITDGGDLALVVICLYV